jgi:glycosyltransferase involved in cell wall biosynthesis
VIDVSHSDGAWGQQTKMVRRAADGADFHVAVSRCALAAFPEEVRSRATVIYNGAEVDRVAPRSAFGISDFGFGIEKKVNRRVSEGRVKPRRSLADASGSDLRPLTALFLGRFEEVKGFDRLFAAAKYLPANWRIVAHGHGSLQSQIPNQKSQIEIRPPLSHVGDALAAADVLVMPSRHEGMPLALVEAWLAGTPVAATPFGFVQEANEMHGPLCEVVPQNPTGEELAAGIVRAAEGRFAEQARNVAWNHYTAAAMAQRWEEFLQAAVAAFRREGNSCELYDAEHRTLNIEH